MGLLRTLNNVGGENIELGKDGKRGTAVGKVEKKRGDTTEVKETGHLLLGLLTRKPEWSIEAF